MGLTERSCKETRLKCMKIDNIQIIIIGLGYVGFPLAVEFGKKYETIGFDTDSKRIDELQQGNDRYEVFTKNEIEKVHHLQLTNKLAKTETNKQRVYIVTVPTPLSASNKPDLGYLLDATKNIGQCLKKGDVVVYESTVYPGCTEEECVPVLEAESGLKFNIDFCCGYSPERINPGDKENTLTRIPKITSGSTPQAAEFVDSLYRSIISAGTHKVSSIRVAEATKLVENIQRYVNVTLMNEFSMLFDKLNVDTEEILTAAATKWNFHTYYPGVIGGPCLEASTEYLVHKATAEDYLPTLLTAAQNTNQRLTEFIINKLAKENLQKKELQPTKIAGICIAPTKPTCNFVTNPHVKKIWEEVEKRKI